MKKIGFILLLVLCIFTCTGCDLFPNKGNGGNGGGNEGGNEGGGDIVDKDDFQIIDVEKSIDFKVDYESCHLLISLDENVKEFNTSQIKVRNGKFNASLDPDGKEMIKDGVVKLNYPETYIYLFVRETNGTSKWEVLIMAGGKIPDVPHFKDEVKLGDWQVIYQLNEAFKGGTLIHIFEGSEYYFETINITKDMIKGFDTKTIGDKKITITYQDYVLETTISVVGNNDIIIPDLPDKPIVETKLSLEETTKLVATFIAIMHSRHASGALFEDAFKEALNDPTTNDMLHNAFQKVGFTSSQISRLYNIVKTKFGPAFEKQFAEDNNMQGLDFIEKLLSTDLINSYKEMVNEVNDVQLFMFMPILLNTDITIDHFNFAEVTMRGLRHTFSEIIDNLKNIDKATIDAFTKQYDLGYKKTTYLGLLNDNRVKYTAKCFKDVLTKLLNASSKDITNIFSLSKYIYKVIYDKKLNGKETGPILKNGVNSINNILSLPKKEDLVTCIRLVMNFNICANIKTYYSVQTVNKAVDTIYDTLTLLTNTINKINDKDFDLIFNYLDEVFNGSESAERPLVKALTIFTKYLMPEFKKMSNTYRNYLADFLLQIFSVNLSNFNSAIDLLDKISTYNHNSISDNDIKNIVLEFDNLLKSMGDPNGGPIEYLPEFVLKSGSDINDLVKYCNDNFDLKNRFKEFGPNLITNATFEVGVNTATITDGYITMYLQYLIADTNDKDRYVLVNSDMYGNYNNGIAFMLNGTKPLKNPYNDKYDYNDKYPNHNFNPNEIRLEFNVLDTKINTLVRRTFTFDITTLNKVKGFETTTKGLHTVLITLNDEVFGSFIVPLTYYVYDGQDEITNVSIKLNSDFIIQNQDFLNIAFVEIEHNYGFNIYENNGEMIAEPNSNYSQESITSEMIQGLDNTKVGPQTITIYYKDKTLTTTIKVISEEEANEIKYIDIQYNSNSYDGLKYDENNLIIFVETYVNSNSFKLQEFNDIYQKLGYKIVCQSDVNHLQYGDNELIYALYKNEKLIKEVRSHFYIDEQSQNDYEILDIYYGGGEIVIYDLKQEDKILSSITELTVCTNNDKFIINGFELVNKFNGKMVINQQNKTIELYSGKAFCEIKYVLYSEQNPIIYNLYIEYDKTVEFDHHPDITEFVQYIHYLSFEKGNQKFEYKEQSEIEKQISENFQVFYNYDASFIRIYANDTYFEIYYKYKVYEEPLCEIKIFPTDFIFDKEPDEDMLSQQVMIIDIFDLKSQSNIFEGSLNDFIFFGGLIKIDRKKQQIDFLYPELNGQLSTYYKVDENANKKTMHLNLGYNNNGTEKEFVTVFNEPTIDDIISNIFSITISNGFEQKYYSGYDLPKLIKNNVFSITLDQKNKTFTITYNLDKDLEPQTFNYIVKEFDFNNISKAVIDFENMSMSYISFSNHFDLSDLVPAITAIQVYNNDGDFLKITDPVKVNEIFTKHAKIIEEQDNFVRYSFFNYEGYVNVTKLDNKNIDYYYICVLNDYPEKLLKGLSDDEIKRVLFQSIQFTMTNHESSELFNDYFDSLNPYLILNKDNIGNYYLEFDETYIDVNKLSQRNTCHIIRENDITNDYFNVDLSPNYFEYNTFDVESIENHISNISYRYTINGADKEIWLYNFKNFKFEVSNIVPGKNTLTIYLFETKVEKEFYLYTEEEAQYPVNIEFYNSNSPAFEGIPTDEQIINSFSDLNIMCANGDMFSFSDNFIEHFKTYNITYEVKLESNEEGILTYNIILTSPICSQTFKFTAYNLNDAVNYKLVNFVPGRIIEIQVTDPKFKLNEDNFLDYIDENTFYTLNFEATLNNGNMFIFSYDCNKNNLSKYFEGGRYYTNSRIVRPSSMRTQVSFVNDYLCIAIFNFSLELNNGLEFPQSTSSASVDYIKNNEGKMELSEYSDYTECIQNINNIHYDDGCGNIYDLTGKTIFDLIYTKLLKIRLEPDRIILNIGGQGSKKVEIVIERATKIN